MTLNIDLAAATYLSAQTEAVATHDQSSFVSDLYDENTLCGTSACMAGHAIAFESGGFVAVKELVNRETPYMVAYEAYLNLTNRAVAQKPSDWWVSHSELNDVEIEERAIAQGLFHDKEDVLAYQQLCYKVFFETKNEDRALAEFKQWVKTHSTDEKWTKFKGLIEMDPQMLLDESGYALHA